MRVAKGTFNGVISLSYVFVIVDMVEESIDWIK